MHGVDKDELYLMAALSADFTSPHMDAIDRCLVHHGSMHEQCLQWEQTAFTPFEPALKRTEATCRHKASGRTLRIMKGSPQVTMMAHTSQSLL